MFTLHKQLENDSVRVTETDKSLLLLANDARYPWLILVPKFADVREVYELTETDQTALWQTSAALSQELMQLFNGDKFNVAALGNMVPQLHIHHIVRHTGDAAWPGPIWGQGEPTTYSSEALQERLTLLRSSLSLCRGSPR